MKSVKDRFIEDYMKKQMKKLKGGEFPAWYENLPGYLQEAYKREFNKLQSKYEK
jgi:hypothetical protein|tara:strand:- start:291 stop:452 length:162 start_codon:yes stop_codon:yes gene_type:complete